MFDQPTDHMSILALRFQIYAGYKNGQVLYNRVSEREDTGNYSPSKLKISQRPKRSLQNHIHSCSLSLSSFCIQLICASHNHSCTICTCYTLSSSCGLWPISPNPAIMQPKWTFPPSIYSTCHTTDILKQLYIATLHLSH